MKNFARSFLVLSIITTFLNRTGKVFAQTQQFNDNVAVNPIRAGYFISDLGLLIQRLAQVGLGIVGLILFGYLIWGGINWVLAGGDKGKIESARSMIVQAVIGFALFASVFVIFSLVTNFLGIRDKVNIVDIQRPGGGNGTGGSNSGGGGNGSGTGNDVCVVSGAQVNDGGSGGYCSGGGAALVKCVAAGVGPSRFPYAHYEPCSCITGTLLPGYSTSGCR